MYLKRLELYGFKSFADRTELEFNRGLTAVVGPNGSGKSNIADAMRWVLGEQSAKSLRGAKMEDIIFSGSDSRKPVNYAEASLTLDNQDQQLKIDFSEVTITRRIYRSGESEFFINRQPCRLKDIVELFMDTGLGRDAYSIIGQGQVEQILSSRPEERRTIFEEAAGVNKYKNRKKEAEKKLEETAANLVRIQDIIHEIESQLDPLREQAERAKRYQHLHKELMAKEIAASVYQIDTLYQQWQEAQENLSRLKEAEEKQLFKINQTEAHLEQGKWELTQLENQLEESQDRLLRMTEELERLERQAEVLQERQKNYAALEKDLKVKLDQMVKEGDKLAQEWQAEQQRLLETEKSLNQLLEEIERREAPTVDRSQELAHQIEQLKGDYIDLLNEQAALRNEERHLKLRLEQESQRLQRLQENKEQYGQELASLSHQRQEHLKELANTQKRLASKHDHVQKLEEKSKEIQRKLNELEQKQKTTLNQMGQVESRYKVLRELKEDYSGYAQGVKAVLKARDKHLEGIDGAVGELIHVPEKYESAIETALGAALQYIVVQDEEAARKAIQYLKQTQSGRATFLPKNILKSRLIPPKERNLIQQADGIVGLAHELVKTDDQFKVVLEYLLGQVIVMHNLKAANLLARTLHYRYRLVTLDGDVVHPGGLMTGGGTKRNKTSFFSRERELVNLENQLAKFKEQVTHQEQQRTEQIAILNEINEGITQTENERMRLQEKEHQLKEGEAQLHYQIKHVQERLELINLDIADTKENIDQISLKLKELAAQSEQTTQQTSILEKEINRLEHLKKEQEMSKAEADKQLTQLKVKAAATQQEHDHLKAQVNRLDLNRKQLDEELNQVQKQLKQITLNLAEQQQQQKEIQEAIEAKIEARNRLNETITHLRQKRRAKQHDLELLEAQIKEEQLSVQEVQAKIKNLEIQIGKLDIELERYLALLREEYQISYEWAKDHYPLEEPYEQTKAQAEQLRQEINALGPVNLATIEHYEQLQERYSFLKNQEQDLKQAKATLDNVIQEMDQEMSQRFKATFEQIRHHFSKIYREMFGGGKADLYLTDPSDLLTTGVEIVAQPPGKKLQYLTLLSGGEKALTAITLLFAILEVKPVPFCVLDEVEAALDEANVSRFAHYLKKKLDKTQFIVITHRKGTMEAADVLYGVTMSEAGVSKLVSVKLLAS